MPFVLCVSTWTQSYLITNFHEFYYFRLMFNVSRAAANHLGLKDLLPETSLPDQLLHQLEILACDSLTLQHRPAEVALALLATNFQQRATREPGHSTALMGFISELQKYCNVSMMISRPGLNQAKLCWKTMGSFSQNWFLTSFLYPNRNGNCAMIYMLINNFIMVHQFYLVFFRFHPAALSIVLVSWWINWTSTTAKLR